MNIEPPAPTPPAAEKVALRNVRVFDGTRILDPGTVVIDDGLIDTDPTHARTIDCAGAILLPGFIDSHVHLHSPDTLRRLASRGVTTALDMATWPPQLVQSLRNVNGLTDIRSAGTPAIGPDGTHAHIPGIPADAIVREPAAAATFIAARVAERADYIKIVIDDHGPNQETVDALIAAAHAHGLQVIVHAAQPGPFAAALRSGADVITHIPVGKPLTADQVQAMAACGHISVPTLTMMEGTAAAFGHPQAFGASLASVGALHRAGVPILAGTDANTQPGVPFQVPHGESLHHEMELLVAAGLSTLDTLRAAISLPAQHFGLNDRGAISPGLRADLVLIDGDPLATISATQNIQRIWCCGHEHTPSH